MTRHRMDRRRAGRDLAVWVGLVVAAWAVVYAVGRALGVW